MRISTDVIQIFSLNLSTNIFNRCFSNHNGIRVGLVMTINGIMKLFGNNYIILQIKFETELTRET